MLESFKDSIHYEDGTEKGENLRKVFSEIFEYADKEKESGKKPLLLVLGGAQRGVYSGGGVIALEKAGLRNGFATVVGVSTGAPVVSYFITGQSEIGNTIYIEDNTGKEFISLKGFKVDVKWLCDVFRGKFNNKGLDVEKLKMSDTNIFYVATESKSDKCVLLNAKELDDPIKGIEASAAIPFLYGKDVNINGENYVDGDVGGQFPVTKILDEIKPTSMLVFANRPKEVKPGLMYRLLSKYAKEDFDKKFIESFKQQDEEFQRELKVLEDSGIPFTIIWTDNLVNNLEKNPKKLKVAARMFERYVTTLIRKNI